MNLGMEELRCDYYSFFFNRCLHFVHFHFSKTSSLNENGTKYPSLQAGHFGKMHELFSSVIFVDELEG